MTAVVDEAAKTTWAWIAGARSVSGLSQKALAERVGVSQPTVSEWEAGVSPPAIIRWRSIADALGVSVADVAVAIAEQFA